MSPGHIPTRTACVRFGSLIRSHFIERVNRFRVQANIEGQEVSAYLANPGRLQELLVSGRMLWLRHSPKPGRKTAYDVVLIQHAQSLVSLNSHLPNALIDLALQQGALPEFRPYADIQREVALGHSRLDFCLRDKDNQRHWIEVKSVTLVEQSSAEFPDAPTKRGRRHLDELRGAVEAGDEATVLFVVQRSDATSFSPHDVTDPAFGEALRRAARAGVDVRAFLCQVTLTSICLDRRIPVHLDGPAC